MKNFPSYLTGKNTRMFTMLWNLTRVTVREKTDSKNVADQGILETELSNLWWVDNI